MAQLKMERMEWEKTIKSWLDDFLIATCFSLGGVNLFLSLCYYCYATENRFKEYEKERKSAKGFLFLGLSVVNATIMIDFEKQIKDKNTTGSKILITQTIENTYKTLGWCNTLTFGDYNWRYVKI